MKKYIFTRIIRKLVCFYHKSIAAMLETDLASIGDLSHIEYPSIISHPERIFIGDETSVLANSRLQCYPDEQEGIDSKIVIGNNCYIAFGVSLLARAPIIIGDNVLISSNVCIVSENHGINPEDKKAYMNQQPSASEIRIGNGCWIGEKVMILSGVKIGEGCVIGAGGVVTHDLPNYCIAVGNPARVIKKYDFETHQWKGVG